jgi:ABC-type Zn2+ transport system substrate-binding protein/surface adhesin
VLDSTEEIEEKIKEVKDTKRAEKFHRRLESNKNELVEKIENVKIYDEGFAIFRDIYCHL